MKTLTGILLVNLGTPNSPAPRDVYKYLIEFLTDPRVIDSSWLSRQLLVRGLIVPKRYRQSAKAYQAIWTSEGSPLKVYGQIVKKSLQVKMGDSYCIELAMRYQQPSINDAIEKLLQKNIHHLVIFPFFPQYASATTGSIFQKTSKVLSQYQTIPKITFINEYSTHPAFINAFYSISKSYKWENFDHVVFSFHGLPERQLKKADRHNYCLKTASCCQQLCEINRSCYSAQCHATALGIAEKLGIPSSRYTICFQSRLGKEPWLQPYASNVIKNLAKNGVKTILAFSPSFVCDCLETIFEIEKEYQDEFKHAGGEKITLVKSLNDHEAWIDALKEMIIDNICN